MGIYKVEIFTPRRVIVVSVKKAPEVEEDDKTSRSSTPPPPPPVLQVETAVGTTAVTIIPPASELGSESISNKKGSFSKGRSTEPTAPTPTSRSLPNSGPPTPTAMPLKRAAPVAADTSDGEETDHTKDHVVAEKAVLKEDGAVEKYHVTYKVSSCKDLKKLEEDEEENEAKKKKDTLAAPEQGKSVDSMTQSFLEDIGSFDPESLAVQFKANGGEFERKGPKPEEKEKEKAPVSDEKEILIENELRLLLSEYPSLVVNWTRCNSLKTINEGGCDDPRVPYVDCCFYAKKRTATTLASRILNEIGIGKDYGYISVVETPFFRPILADEKQAKGGDYEAADANFVEQVSQQIQFDQMLSVVKDGATISFDFVAFLVIAALIAGTGLAANSTVAVVASMLVSPMMGPILGTVLGSFLMVQNRHTNPKLWRDGIELVKGGFLMEFFCLFACIFIGFIIGLCFWGNTDLFNWGSEGNPEMLGRTTTHGLLIGIVIALPSGMGVALSQLSENSNSLVGVAISASLLPPAVNCGLYFAFAIMRENEELARKGAISFTLTMLNVVSIYVSALGTIYLKKATPMLDYGGRQLPTTLFDAAKLGVAATDNQTFQDRVKAHRLKLKGHQGLTKSATQWYLEDESEEESSEDEFEMGKGLGARSMSHVQLGTDARLDWRVSKRSSPLMMNAKAVARVIQPKNKPGEGLHRRTHST